MKLRETDEIKNGSVQIEIHFKFQHFNKLDVILKHLEILEIQSFRSSKEPDDLSLCVELR